MLNSNTKKWVGLGVVVVLVVGLVVYFAALRPPVEEPEPAVEEQEPVVEEQDPAVEEPEPVVEEPIDEDRWKTPFEETVQIRIVLPEDPHAVFAEGEDMTDNLWTRKFKEKFNVEVIVDWISADYETKLNLAIAARELPDAFRASIVQFNQMADAGMLEDLTGAYNNYASPGLRELMEANWDIVETAMRDDKIYAMPALHFGYETSTMFLWGRKDWAEANNITSVNTIEDFENMMRAFMQNNGAEFGTMLDRSLGTFYQMAPAFHAYPAIWVEGPDGSIVHGATLPETKEALAKWAEWYRDGLIRQDFATIDWSAMVQDALTGRVGTIAHQNWIGWVCGKDMVNNQGEGSYFIPFNLPSIDGRMVMFPVSFPNFVYNVVREGYEHPEALVKLISKYLYVLTESVATGTMTIEEVLPFKTNHMHHITGPFVVWYDHYDDIIEVANAVRTGERKFSRGSAYLYFEEIMRWVNDGDLTGMGRWLQMGREPSSLGLAIAHIDNNQILKSRLWGASPQVLVDYGAPLRTLLIEGFTKIIMGVEDINYYYTLIENWRRAGGDEVTAAINEMYGR